MVNIFLLGVPSNTIGLLCSSRTYIKYLIDQSTTCSHQGFKSKMNFEYFKHKYLIEEFKHLKIVTSPHLINVSNEGKKVFIKSYVLETSNKD